MAWELHATGHIRVDAGTDQRSSERVAALEAELAGRIRDILAEEKYGCTSSALHGAYVTAAPHTGDLHRKPAEPAVHRTGETR